MPQFRHLSWRAVLRLFCVVGILILLLMRPEFVYAQTPQRVILSRTKPDYPALAMRMRISGSVRVLASVEPDGTVSRVHAASGHAFLQGPAEQAVRQWKFAKAPSASEATVEVRFNLDSSVNP